MVLFAGSSRGDGSKADDGVYAILRAMKSNGM